MTMYKHLMTAVTVGTFAVAAANASTLKFVAGSAASSMDPQFHNTGANIAPHSLIFEELVYYDKDGVGGLSPRLATKWVELPGDKLEMHLRKGVKFHDGTDFTANDVIYTICRMSRVKNSPGSFEYKASSWTDIEVVNDHKIIIQKDGPAPRMMMDAARFMIISDSVAGSPKINFNKGKCDGFKYAETDGFNTGKLAIGSGPYKYKSYVKNQSITVVKNTNYWGSGSGNSAANFDKIEITAIKNKGSRLAALLAGDVNAIESPSTHDLDRLRKDPNVKLIVNDPVRSIVIHFNRKGVEPFFKGTNGKNPFEDVRVRKAFSLAVNRDLLVKRVMGELAIPATNVSVPGFLGVDSKNHYEYNPKKAKQLLAEAGYPNGFEVTFGAPNDRYINDAKVAQALAQMWERIGVKVNVEASTKSLFFSKWKKAKSYGVALIGWGVHDGDPTALISTWAGHNKAKKRGNANHHKIPNGDVEKWLDKAEGTANVEQRKGYLKNAIDELHKHMPMFVVHYERFPLAVNKSVAYSPPLGGEKTYLRYFKSAK